MGGFFCQASAFEMIEKEQLFDDRVIAKLSLNVIAQFFHCFTFVFFELCFAVIK